MDTMVVAQSGIPIDVSAALGSSVRGPLGSHRRFESRESAYVPTRKRRSKHQAFAVCLSAAVDRRAQQYSGQRAILQTALAAGGPFLPPSRARQKARSALRLSTRLCRLRQQSFSTRASGRQRRQCRPAGQPRFHSFRFGTSSRGRAPNVESRALAASPLRSARYASSASLTSSASVRLSRRRRSSKRFRCSAVK